MLRLLSSVALRAAAAILVLAPPTMAGDCFPRKTIAASTVLVPATVGGHTNMLVAVPNTVAFSQIAVQVGVPTSTYSPVAYQQPPAGPGLPQPGYDGGVQVQGQAASGGDALAAALNAINARLAKLEGKNGATAQGDSPEAVAARVHAIFQQSCVSCHSSEAHKGSFRMIDEAGNVLPLPRAKILARVKTDDESKRMPKGGHKLAPEQIADIEKWQTLPADAVW